MKPQIAPASANKPISAGTRMAIAAGAIFLLLGTMALDTKFVKIGSPSDIKPGVFSPEVFGRAEFPKVQSDIEGRAASAATLAQAIAKDAAAAGREYGTEAGAGPVMPVKFTGIAGKAESGVYFVEVAGLADTIVVRVQTGPAINGTDLRDATGKITFGQFVNQIDYQNAGSALNKEMKQRVLSKIDASTLSGKTILVTGVFKLINPNNWLVTPVRLEIK